MISSDITLNHFSSRHPSIGYRLGSRQTWIRERVIVRQPRSMICSYHSITIPDITITLVFLRSVSSEKISGLKAVTGRVPGLGFMDTEPNKPTVCG
jgi:hypothetical protein